MTILLPGSDSLSPPGAGGVIKNFSTATQTPAAATRTYLAGSALAVPSTGLKVGAKLRWKLQMTKTAAGVAASTFDICFGTLGTVADTAQVSFVKPAGTAAADEGTVEVEAIVKSVSATGVVLGEFTMLHNLAATGHAQIPVVAVNTVSAGFDNTGNSLIVGLCITSGAADAITITMVQASLTDV